MNIAYVERGEGSNILIFLHGFCETKELWLEFVQPLTKQYRVLIPDLPGFGASSSPEGPLTFKEVATALWTWLDRLDLPQAPVLVGHSMGGYTALAMADQRTSQVQGLTLFHSTALADSKEKKNNRDKAIELVKKRGLNIFLNTFIPSLVHRQDTAIMKNISTMMRQTSPQAHMAYTQAMRDRPSYLPMLQKCQIPVQYIVGDNDNHISITSIQQQVSGLPSSILSIIEDTGHMGMLESANPCRKALSGFLENLDLS